VKPTNALYVAAVGGTRGRGDKASIMTSQDILKSNPFKKQIFAPQGDGIVKDTFVSVGTAISAWEHCEVSFGTIYAALVKPAGGTHVVLRAYGTILAPSARREMIRGAAEAYFAVFENKPLSKALQNLMSLHEDGATRRNEIVHGYVMSEPLMPGRKPSYFLVPSLFTSKKNKLHHQRSKYRFSTRELDNYCKCFEALSSRAMKFQQDLRAFYSSLPDDLREKFP